MQEINTNLCKALVGTDECDQKLVDQLTRNVDGTSNKHKCGANALLGVSMAVARAGAAKKKMPLYRYLGELSGNDNFCMPVPAFNVINGGSHAGNALSFQEFMIMPTGAESFSQAMQMGAEIYHILKQETKKRYGQDAINVGDEGGFAPPLSSNKEGLQLLMTAVELSGYKDQVKLAMDVASSEFFTSDHKYDLGKKTPHIDVKFRQPVMTADELKFYFQDLCETFPIVSIEDPFEQVCCCNHDFTVSSCDYLVIFYDICVISFFLPRINGALGRSLPN